MAWRNAKSLDVYRGQINDLYPRRNKASDGTKASSQHTRQNPNSDHEPNKDGVVTAQDITHDPKNGCDCNKIVDALVRSRDSRIKYIIWNRRIINSSAAGGAMPWTWRPYGGSNPHDKHSHLSVSSDPAKYDDTAPWKLDGSTAVTPTAEAPPTVQPALPAATNRRMRMAKTILDYEARRDSRGHLVVYNPPANDGGGAFEVAGITINHHPEMATELRGLIAAGKHGEVDAKVVDYIAKCTDIAAQWTKQPGVEFMLRDSVFHRGPKGAARILQRAISVPDDGAVGPQTREAMDKVIGETDGVTKLLSRLRWAREDYEEKVVGRRENLWRGLRNRWNHALDKSIAFQKEAPARGVGTAVTTAAVGGAVIANQANNLASTMEIVIYSVALLVIVASAFLIVRKLRQA
jgi:hypothetical protein